MRASISFTIENSLNPQAAPTHHYLISTKFTEDEINEVLTLIAVVRQRSLRGSRLHPTMEEYEDAKFLHVGVDPARPGSERTVIRTVPERSVPEAGNDHSPDNAGGVHPSAATADATPGNGN